MQNDMLVIAGELIAKTRGVSRHEAAHFIIAFAQGFQSKGVSAHIGLAAHRGKSYSIEASRCESLEQLQDYMRRRITILLAGAMGEALVPETLKLDATAAMKILEEGDTGAGQDYAIAKELIQMIHCSMPQKKDDSTGKALTSRDLLCDSLGQTWTLVHLNATSICQLAQAVEVGVIANQGKYELFEEDIYTLQLFNPIPSHSS